MAGIASARAIPASGASTPTISSQRTSLDTTRTSSPSRPTPQAVPGGQPHARRNRAALRDYYNLKPNADAPSSLLPSSAASVTSSDLSVSPDNNSELDKPSFDPAAYVRGILEKEGLQAVLKTEGALLNEIRELDGERKALVYDNYSKLIAATETIRGMRRNMAPLDASTGDLKGMVGRIAETAGGLAEVAGAQGMAGVEGQEGEEVKGVGDGGEKRRRQKETVRWVLGGPARLRTLVTEGRWEEAEALWERMSTLLDKWEGVDGVEAIRDQCLEALRRKPSDDEV